MLSSALFSISSRLESNDLPSSDNFDAALLKSHEPIESFDENLIVIYNRVPKTGSTSFINLAYDLCKKNHFYVLHINITANMHVLSLENQVRHWNGSDLNGSCNL